MNICWSGVRIKTEDWKKDKSQKVFTKSSCVFKNDNNLQIRTHPALKTYLFNIKCYLEFESNIAPPAIDWKVVNHGLKNDFRQNY